MQQSSRYHLHIVRIVRPMLAFLAIVLLLPSLLQAQQPDPRTTGTSYVLAYPDTVRNTFDLRYPNQMEDKILIYMYSAVGDNRITVTGNGYNRVVTAEAGKFTILDLTDATFTAPAPVVTEWGRVSKNTFRVDAQKPIVVYCYMVTKFGCAAWTPIPVEFWGNEYYAQSLPAEIIKDEAPAGEFNYYTKRREAPAEITVIAAEDNTLVTFVPTSNSRLRDNPQVNNVRLNRNEAYLIQSDADTSEMADPAEQPDLGGVYITSNKPVGVLSGNTRAAGIENELGLAKNSFKDMTMEWVAPVEQHGRQFVYMPTMDSRRPTGTPGEDLSEKRSAELVRVYATNDATKGTVSDAGTGETTEFTIDRRSAFSQHRINVPQAVVFKTDKPAQTFMNTSAVVKFLGTTGYGGGYTGAKYDAWGTYSVEMVPREEWISSAPYFAPVHPSNMDHFINIVTDTISAKSIYWGLAGGSPANAFLLNKPIKGTDLVWGSMAVTPGLDLFITGWNTKTGRQDTSIRFYGFVYGLRKGHEEYRPGRTGKKDEDGSGIASGGKGDEVLHPSEYEEYLSVAYGYPLAPSRTVISDGDSLVIETSDNCGTMNVRVRAVNEDATGLRSIKLDSIMNTKLVLIQPSDLTGATAAEFNVLPINSLQNASAIIVITDRANKSWRIPYSYKAQTVKLTPGGPLDFGAVTVGTAVDTVVMVSNPLTGPVVIKALNWVFGNQGFQLITPPSLPLTLGPGEWIAMRIRSLPAADNRAYMDSLRIVLDCIEYRVQVKTGGVLPILSVASELNFGLLRLTQSDTLQLRICNTGSGTINFNNPAGGDVITGLGALFRIDAARLNMLKNTVLGPDDCATVPVIFAGSDQPGYYGAQAILWTNLGADTVKLSATVLDLPLGVGIPVEGKTVLYRIDPNPFHGMARLQFSLRTAGDARLEIFDATGQRIATLVDGTVQSGSHEAVWDASQIPAGTYYCRLTVGEWSSSQVLIVR